MNSFYVRLLLAFLLANFVVLAISVFGTRALLGGTEQIRIDYDLDAVHALLRQTFQEKGARGIRDLNERYRSAGLEFVLFENGRPTGSRVPRPVRDFADQLSLTQASTLELPRAGEYLHSVPLTGPGVAANSVVVTFQRNLRLEREGPGRPPPPGGVPPGPADGGSLVPSPTRTTFVVYLVLLSLGIALAGWVVARNMTAPLRSVQTTIKRFANGDLSARVGAHLAARGDDMGRLAGDFDRMAEHVAKMIESRDRLLHQLSHEMRSPLARLRFAIELSRGDASADDSYLQRADKEVDRLDRLMDEMLQMARAQSLPNQRALEDIGLNEFLDAAVSRATLDAQARQVSLSFNRGDDAVFAGYPDLLERAIDNVLRNAVKFSPEGGTITVAGGAHDDAILIEVADEGPGVLPGELSELFEPFYRASNSDAAEGYGLGLAIVASAMRAHDGHAEAENRRRGGLCVRLRFPRRRETQ